MSRIRSWSDEQLRVAVKESTSYRSVIAYLGLIPAGGNYSQVRRRVMELGLKTEHFKGQAWNKGMSGGVGARLPIESLLVVGSGAQSHKLKKRLYEAGLKLPVCELCGWSQAAIDGRIPLELDHINGDHADNRIDNLRILCPNCHSLQPTHRGKNKKARRARMS